MFVFVNCLAIIPGKEDEALEVFARATRIDPDDHEPELTARGYLSRMLRRVDRITEAEEHEDHAAYVIPTCSMLTMWLIQTLVCTGDRSPEV